MSKYIYKDRPLLGINFNNRDVGDAVYALAEKFVEVIVEQKTSYTEACTALDIAKEGLKTLILTKEE